MRFVPDRTRNTEGMDYPGAGVSDAVFMTSRDGVHWDRTFMEAWLRPGADPRNWTHRSNMPGAGIIETAPGEWSLYVGENYGWATNRLQRVTVRRHGFASVHAGHAGGEMLTGPIRFSGGTLRINAASSAVGSVSVEVQGASGRPLKGYALKDARPFFGDELDAAVLDVSAVAGRPVRLRFALKDADLFAFRTDTEGA
jgi:hypothetical protein